MNEEHEGINDATASTPKGAMELTHCPSDFTMTWFLQLKKKNVFGIFQGPLERHILCSSTNVAFLK